MTTRFDPAVALPRPSPEMEAATWSWPPARIQRVEWAGRPAWLKRAAHGEQRTLRLARRLWIWVRAPLGVWSALPRAGGIAVQREARRLIWLHEQGFHVPRVLGVGKDWLLLEDGGVSARSLMPALEADARQALLAGILSDLLSFHRAGLWRGGAQIKNTLVGTSGRMLVDFEEDFDGGSTLLDLQARDLTLFLMSCVDWVPETFLRSLVAAYTAGGGAAQVVARAHRVTAVLSSRVFAWVKGRDAARARVVAGVLAGIS